MEESNVPWWLVLLEGIAAIILGVLLITNTGRTTVVLIQLLGIYWLLKGIFSIIAIFIDSSQWGWKLLIGILGIAAGILVIGSPIWSTAIVTLTLVLVIGINGIIIGIVEIIQAFQGGGLGVGLLGVLSVILGILLVVHRWNAAAALPYALAIFLLIGGLVAIVAAFRMR
jgi:uncharacterized membrane protein HdeD (DUF308 family)